MMIRIVVGLCPVNMFFYYYSDIVKVRNVCCLI